MESGEREKSATSSSKPRIPLHFIRATWVQFLKATAF